MYKKLMGFVAVITSWLLLQSGTLMEGKQTKIYISQFAAHPALDATTKGLRDGLTEAGYISGKNLDLQIESAQGNASLATQIANKFVSNKPDIVVGVATVSAQSLAKFAKSGPTKLIFTTVTDPLGAGLVKTVEKPENNSSGVSNFVPLEPQIEMFKQVKPSIKKLGFLYNTGEANSLSLIEKLKIICPKYGIELVTLSANKTSEVAGTAIKLSSLVDAIFVSNDNTALAAFPTIIKAANKQKIPVFVSDTDIIGDGAIAALGPNQYEIGKQTAQMIVQVLGGRDINSMSVEFPKKTELFLNQSVANKLGIKFSKELLNKAKEVVN